jgi:beta-lactamase regulating signal transducer with metallopeptidase domain
LTPILHSLGELGHYAVTWSWQLAMLVGLLWIVLRFDRRHRPELRYRLLFLTLVLSVLLPWFPGKIATLSWTSRIKEVWLEPVEAAAMTASRTEPGIDRSISSIVPLLPAAAETSVTTRHHLGILFPALGFLWCAGMTIAALRKLQLHRRFAGIIRRATVSSVKAEATLPILMSEEVSGPMLYGFWRPVILLPANISDWSTPEERAAVVRHECVHVKRKDHWVLALEGAMRAILFFHPMFRWVCQRLDIERELVCDAEVLRLGSDPGVYTRTLLNVAQNAVVQSAGVYFSSASELTERVELLLRPHRTARIVLATVPLILLTPLVSLGFWQASIESFEPVESAWTLRFLPHVPVEAPAGKVVVPPLAPLPTPLPEELTQEPALPPTPQPRGSRTSVMVLRGQGVQNEVRVTLGIPYTDLTFLHRTTAAGTTTLQASANVVLDVTILSGRSVAHRDDPIEINVLGSSFSADGIGVWQEVVLLPPGLYRLRLQVMDTAAGTTWVASDRRLEVPELARTSLAASSLVTADLLEKGSRPGVFSIGDLKVRPNVSGKFRRDQTLNIFQQVYSDGTGSLGFEVQIRTPQARILERLSDELQKSPQINITKSIPLSDLPPGSYEILTAITDPGTGTSVVSSEPFTVE